MKYLFTEMTCLHPVIFLVLILPMQGCTFSGWKSSRISPDTSILTSSIETGSHSLNDSISLLDQKIIRDTVTSAGKKNLTGKSISWFNADTGSRGVISALTETRENGKTCRTFQTTREAFDGVMLFAGKTCKETENVWRLDELKAL